MTAVPRATIAPPTSRHLPPAAHAPRDNTTSNNSVLDARGDVVLFRDGRGTQYLFRDGHDDGLLLGRKGDRWTLTRVLHAHVTADTGSRWELVAHAAPVCSGGWETSRRAYVARHLATGRAIAIAGTQYGLLARAARQYLRGAERGR